MPTITGANDDGPSLSFGAVGTSPRSRGTVGDPYPSLSKSKKLPFCVEPIPLGIAARSGLKDGERPFCYGRMRSDPKNHEARKPAGCLLVSKRAHNRRTWKATSRLNFRQRQVHLIISADECDLRFDVAVD